ncbi:hypothetical protein JL721_7035 [Aureococcus anophagefferens]|nr:hypothetical protein JL721_7035 [Aureococcus anophagefferens]
MLKGYAARNKRPDLAEGTVLTDVAPPLEGKVNEKMKVAEVDDADLDEKLYFIDVETETGGTALLVACAAGNVLLADELLQRGAEANHENLRGAHGAHGHAKVLQVLVDRLFYDAQMKRHEALRPDRPTPLPEKEARVSERHWLRDFEEAVHYLAVNVLRTAEARIEQRQNELVQGDLKQAPKVCPRNCGAGMLKACDLTSHMLNDCELRPAGCDNCGGTLPKRFLLEHQATDCPARMVDCHMCGASILASSWKAHREFRCPLRTVTCRMGCGQEMPCEQLAQHELIRCRWRGLPCPLPGCGREIRAYEAGQGKSTSCADHKKKECLRRLVKCRLGCGLQLPFEDRDKHEQEVCTQVCQWDGCGQRIGPEEHRRLHERFHCERRGVPCPFACGIPGVAANAMKVHAEFVCPQRPATCPYCAWEGVFEDLRLHADAERGNCPERQMRCRYDMVGRRVSWFVAAKRARARAAGRNGDDEGYERGVLRRYNPDTDEFLLFGSAKPEWVKLADLDGFSLIDTDNFKCYWVSSARMKTHLRRKCPCRPFAGRQKTADELSDSDASVEELVLEEAEPGDGGDEPVPEAEVPRWDDDAPEEEETPYDAREGVRIDPRTRDEHGVEVGTSKRCKYACGRVFPMTDLGMDEYGYHVLKLCGKRPVTCPHCGDAELWAEEFEDHPANCPVLTFEPPPPGFTCACGEYVADSDKVEHMVGCVAKECYCPQGCGVKMLQSKLEKHKKDECIRRHLRHGVLIELESNDGYNALTKACGLDNIEHVEILWRAGAMINAETAGRTPLIEAAKEGHLATCRYLVDRGAVIEYKSRQRKTAIQWASISGHARPAPAPTDNDRELGAEDAALDGATAELDQLHKEMRKFAFAEREQNRNLLSKSKLAHIVDGMADDVMECRDKLDRNVADQLRKAALALKTIEAADVIELTSLKSTAVKQRVFRVLIICCELLGAKLPPPTAALANAASLSEPTSLGGDEASGLVEGTSMGTPEVRQAAQEKKHRVETWKACKKLLKTPNLLRQLRFFTDAMAPSTALALLRAAHVPDEYRDGSKLLSEALSMSASTMKSSKGRPETVNEDDDESHTTHLTGDSQMTKPPEYDSDGYEIPDESHLPESERTTPEDREAAKGVRRAAVRARVADTPPFFEVEGSSNVSDASTTSSTVDGYQIVGVLALWANAHIASIEAKSCVRDLDEQERGLRARFDLSREPEMLVAKRDAYVAASRVKMIEREVEQLEKEVKHRQNRVVAWEGKAEAARVVQLVYRHHVWRPRRPPRRAGRLRREGRAGKRETEFKFILQRALTVYMDKRTTHRLPLCEAAYNRNGNVFEAFERRRILYTGRHLYETALYPEPPFPFARRPPVAAHLRKRLY